MRQLLTAWRVIVAVVAGVSTSAVVQLPACFARELVDAKQGYTVSYPDAWRVDDESLSRGDTVDTVVLFTAPEDQYGWGDIPEPGAAEIVITREPPRTDPAAAVDDLYRGGDKIRWQEHANGKRAEWVQYSFDLGKDGQKRPTNFTRVGYCLEVDGALFLIHMLYRHDPTDDGKIEGLERQLRELPASLHLTSVRREGRMGRSSDHSSSAEGLLSSQSKSR